MRKLSLYRPSWTFNVLFLVLILTTLGSLAAAQSLDINDTRLLAQPAISKTHVAFIYAGDLWAADLDGRNVRRLTADEGVEANPSFSPDGKNLAFACTSSIAVYSIYELSLSGGSLQLLASIMGYSQGLAWSVDGTRIIFSNDSGDGGALWQVSMDSRLTKLPFGEQAFESSDCGQRQSAGVCPRLENGRHMASGSRFGTSGEFCNKTDLLDASPESPSIFARWNKNYLRIRSLRYA